jgi:hypothetical protein
MAHEIGHFDPIPTSQLSSGKKEEEEIIKSSGKNQFDPIPMDQVTIINSSSTPSISEEQSNKSWYQPAVNFFSGFNTAVANMLQVPVDVGRAAHQVAFGGDVASWLPNYDPKHPTAGASAINDLFQMGAELEQKYLWSPMGVDTQADTESYGGQVGEEAAYNIASLLPVARAAQISSAIGRPLAKGAEKFTYEVFQPLVSYVRNAPMTAALIDLGLSVPMGILAEYGERVRGETGKQLGRLAGASALAVPSLLRSTVVSPVKWTAQKTGHTKTGKERVVGQMLEGAMTPEQLALARSGEFDAPTVGGPFTSAEILDAGGLARLRYDLLRKSDPSLQAEKQRLETRQAELLRALEVLEAKPLQNETSVLISRRIKASIANIEAHKNKAIAKAQVRIDKLHPDQSEDVASRIARDELEKAYTAARKEEDRLWKLIGNGVFLTDDIIRIAKQIINETPRLSGPKGQPAIPDAIWDVAGRAAVIGPAGKIITKATPSILRSSESIDEIAALSSRINADIRASDNLNEKRTLGDLRDVIYDNLTPVAGSDATGLEQARTYSKYLNNSFTRGSVGRVLGLNTKYDVKVEPDVTLEKFVVPGVAGKVAVEQLRKAGSYTEGGVAALDAHVQQFLLNKFALAAVNNEGAVSVTKAQNFIRRNPVLDLYPALRDSMLDANKAQLLVSRVTKEAANRITNIEKESIASQFINAEASVAIKNVFNKNNPIKATQELLRLASKDTTGRATEGLKSAFYHHLIDNVTRTGANGVKVLAPAPAVKFIANATNRAVIKTIYGNEGVRLLDSVVKGMKYQDRGKIYGTLAREGGARAPSRELVGNMGTILGARALGKITGHTLLAASQGKNWLLKAFDVVRDAPVNSILVILQKALDDPEYASLLVKPLSGWTNEDAIGFIGFATRQGLMSSAMQEAAPGTNFIQ